MTRLLEPTGIAVDSFRNRLYVVNHSGEILIWNDAASLSGGVPPTTVIAGPSIGLVAGDHPLYLDVKTDTLYVANGSHILVFEKLGLLAGDPGVAPTRTLFISKGISQAGLAGDPIGDLLFVSSREANGAIHQVSGVSSVPEEAVPAATLSGAETGLDQTTAMTLAGNVLMALNLGGSEIRVWHQADQKDGDRSPTQILDLTPASLPTALFYVATQNEERDQAEHALTVQKSGDGSVTSDLPGINCGTTCISLFAVGDTVTLTAVAQDDSPFAGRGGACSGTDSCVVTMDAAKTVTAIFGDTQAPRVSPFPPPSSTPTTVKLSPVADTFLNVDASVNSAEETLNTYTWPANRIANAALMKFDLSGFPAGAAIQVATLNLSLVGADAMADATYTIGVHKIINKNPDLARATGYTYDGTNAWTANDCCSNNIPLAQADISVAYDTEAIDKTFGNKIWDITAMVREWIGNPSVVSNK